MKTFTINAFRSYTRPERVVYLHEPYTTAILRCITLDAMMLFCVCTAKAQQDTTITAIHNINEVVIKQDKRTRTIQSSLPTQSLNKSEIDSWGLQNVADALRHFAGTNVRDYGGIGGLKTVSVRNLGASHTGVAYDGVTVGNCQAGQIDVGRFLLDNISELSLSVGNSEELLQSARQFTSAGILNIVSEQPHFYFGHPYQFMAQIRTGSFGMLVPSLKWCQRLSSATSLSVSGTMQRADGNYPYLLENGRLTETHKRRNSDITSYNGEANLYTTFRDSTTLKTKVSYFYSERGLPGNVILYNNTKNERLWDEEFFSQLVFRKKISQQWSLQLQGKFNHSWNRYEDTDVKYSGGKQTDIFRQEESYLQGTILYHPYKHITLSMAQDGFVNTLRSNMESFVYPTRYTWLSALNARYECSWFNATATLTSTFIHENLKEDDAPDNRKRLSPTLSVSIQPWKEQMLYIRAMYKNTFRTPNFNDLYYLRMGNKGLKPEKATEYNVGITWSGKPFEWIDMMSITIDGYINKVDDKIVAFPSTYVWKMANFGKVDIKGLDMTLMLQLPITGYCNLRVQGTYTYQKSIDVTDPKAANYKGQLPYTPCQNGSFGAVLNNPIVNIGYTLTGVSKRYFMSENIPENIIEGYIEQNVNLSRDFNFKSWRLHLSGELMNITNKQYQIIKYYPMPGRNFRVTTKIDF